MSRTAPIRSVIVGGHLAALAGAGAGVPAQPLEQRLEQAAPSTGTQASVSSVSRSEIWLRTTSVVATTTRFWNSESSDAVMTVLVWSTSVMIPEMSCAGAGPLEVAQVERQQVVEDAGAEIAHQALLHPDRDLARRVGSARS